MMSEAEVFSQLTFDGSVGWVERLKTNTYQGRYRFGHSTTPDFRYSETQRSVYREVSSVTRFSKLFFCTTIC